VTQAPLVDVVVVTFNSTATVRAAVDSVLCSEAVASVTIVDNASVNVLPHFGGSRVKVVANPRNLGFARAVNSGLRHGTSAYVLLLNPDAEISDESLGRLIHELECDEKIAMVGPLLMTPTGSVTLGARRFSTLWNRTAPFWPLLNRRSLHFDAEYKNSLRVIRSKKAVPVDYLWGACLLARRSFLESLGGLDERFFLYSEDEDLGRQARRCGYKTLLVTSARALHIGNVSSGGRTPLVRARQIYANRQLLEKWEGAETARLFGLGVKLGLYLNLGLYLTLAAARVSARKAGAEELQRVLYLLHEMARRGSAI
jgi:N-acetylglucosaminyl-diphospho-decaprenol L-rhamnosyltransferase